MSVVIDSRIGDENMLYSSPENDTLNDSKDNVSKDSNALMEDQMSASNDHLENGPQQPQHIFVLGRESSLGKREHRISSDESSVASSTLLEDNAGVSPRRQIQVYGKKKQKLSARQRKRQLERKFGSDFKPGTIRHRLNFLQHNFGDQLALIEESLPKTFFRNMNLETFIKNKMEQHEQHMNTQDPSSSSMKRSPSFRRSPERQRKSSVKDMTPQLSGIKEQPSSRQQQQGSAEMAEIMTFAPLETPHFEEEDDVASAPEIIRTGGSFPLDRSAREWRLSKFLEESPPPSPSPPPKKEALPEAVSMEEESDLPLQVPILVDVQAADPAVEPSTPAEEASASVPVTEEEAEKEAVVAPTDETPAPVVDAPTDEKDEPTPMEEEEEEPSADVSSPTASNAPADAFRISAAGIVEDVVSTPEKEKPKEEDTALVEEPTPVTAEESAATPATEEEAVSSSKEESATTPATEEEVVSTPKAIEESATPEAAPMEDEPATAAPVVEEAIPEVAKEAPVTTEESPTTAPVLEEATPEVAKEAPVTTVEPPTTAPVLEEATPEVAKEAPVTTVEPPTSEEPTAEEPVEKRSSITAAEIAGDAGEEEDMESSHSSVFSQPEGVVEAVEPQTGGVVAEPTPVVETVPAATTTMQEEGEDPVSVQVKESASQIPDIGEDSPSRGESPQVQAKKVVAPTEEAKQEISLPEEEEQPKPQAPSQDGVVSEPVPMQVDTPKTAPQEASVAATAAESSAPATPSTSDGVMAEEEKPAPAIAVDTTPAPAADGAPSTPVGDQSVSPASAASFESPKATLDAVERARLEQATPIKTAEATAAATPPTPDAVERARLEQQTPVKSKPVEGAATEDAATKEAKPESGDAATAATTDENKDAQNCPSPNSVMDSELGDGKDQKPVKKQVPLKENRKIRFADEAGQSLTKEYVIEREANYASRIVVMLLSPRDRKFEFLHAEYPLDESTTVQVLLEQVPLLATNDAFRTKKFNALLQTETSRQLDNKLALQDYCFKESEIVLGIPDDFTVANMTKMAVPLLLNKKIDEDRQAGYPQGTRTQDGSKWRRMVQINEHLWG